MKKSSICRLAAGLALGGAVIACVLLLPVKHFLRQVLELIEGMGGWGPVVLTAVFVPTTLLFIPEAILTMGAGYVYGLALGTLVASIGSTLGVSATFLVGRTLARGWVEEKIGRYAKFRAIDQAIARQGFKITLLIRLAPGFPLIPLSYAFGLTKVRFRDYVLASWIGMLPVTVMYVYLGSLVKSMSDLFAGGVGDDLTQKVLLVLGLVGTVAVTILVTRIAKQALDKAVPNIESSEETALNQSRPGGCTTDRGNVPGAARAVS